MSKFDKTQWEQFKNKLNRKIVLGAFAMLMCLALIIVCSFSEFIIDPRRIATNEFLTDELIIIAIVIMSMVSAMAMAQSSNAQNPLSRISKSRVVFFNSLKVIEDKNVNAFRQWVRQRLQPEDVVTIKVRRLRALGINDVLILELDETQLESLWKDGAGRFPIENSKDPDDRKGRYFKRITEEQYKGILKIMESEYKIHFVEPEYYLSVKNFIDNRTISERSSNESKKKGLFMFSRVAFRLTLSIMSAMIFAALVRDISSDMDAAEAWAKFFARLWAMLSSSFMGHIVGTQMNDIDAEYVEMRTQVHTRYLQDTEFKPLSDQEEAKEEFKKRVMKETVLSLDNKSNQIEMKTNPSKKGV